MQPVSGLEYSHVGQSVTSEPQIHVSASPLPEGINPFYLGVVPPPPALAPAALVDAPLTTLSKGQRKKANKKCHLEKGNILA